MRFRHTFYASAARALSFDSTGHLLPGFFDYYTGEPIVNTFVFGSDIIDIGNSWLLIISTVGCIPMKRIKKLKVKWHRMNRCWPNFDYPKRSHVFLNRARENTWYLKRQRFIVARWIRNQRIIVINFLFNGRVPETSRRSRASREFRRDTTRYITGAVFRFFRTAFKRHLVRFC